MNEPSLTIQRLRHVLETVYVPLIDAKDLVDEDPSERERKLLSRAVAAFALWGLSGCTPEQAADSITDGYDDGGLDAVYFDANENRLYLVQAKWNQKGNKSVEQGDTAKFLRGVRTLIEGSDFSSLSSKVQLRQIELLGLLKRSDVQVCLVVAYTSNQPLSQHCAPMLDEYVSYENSQGGAEVFALETCKLERLYKWLSGNADPKVTLHLTVYNWNCISDPYQAYYGCITVGQVAEWSSFGRILFAKNLRYFAGSTDVNDRIRKTLAEEPGNFWYFNNGITILARKVGKGSFGGAERKTIAQFTCEGASVVNGAQTVGVIWEWAKELGVDASESCALVNVRIISLEKCPDGFDSFVTRATNTQNEIRQRDFAALDPKQKSLAQEMGFDGKRYAFKSNDPDPLPSEGCNIEESTVALACANQDIFLAYQAKREVGILWENTDKPPYTTIFHDQLDARTMWRAVLIMREVDMVLAKIDKSQLPRGELVAVHGNRFILHQVFKDPSIRAFRNPAINIDNVLAAARSRAAMLLKHLSFTVQAKFPGDYLAVVFKNLQKYRELDVSLQDPERHSGPDSQPQQTNIFDQLK